MMNPDAAGTPRPRKDLWVLALAVVIVAVAIAGLIVARPYDPTTIKLPFRAFSFPSTSMEPTLRLGEYAFANMLAYGGRNPERGDIVTFSLPRDPSTTYVKRVVGMPGEKVQLKNGILHINGQPVPTADAGTYKLHAAGQPEKIAPLKRETLPNGVSFETLDLVSNGPFDNTAAFDVPAGQYFVLGDNRDNSVDSRMPDQVGYVPQANLLGRISWIFWSPDTSRIGTVPK
jgi:signal peptidase I